MSNACPNIIFKIHFPITGVKTKQMTETGCYCSHIRRNTDLGLPFPVEEHAFHFWFSLLTQTFIKGLLQSLNNRVGLVASVWKAIAGRQLRQPKPEDSVISLLFLSESDMKHWSQMPAQLDGKNHFTPFICRIY